MKAQEFDLSKDIHFDFLKGWTTFRGSRLVIFDANAIGLLRSTLVEELGYKRARSVFLRFGYQNGYADFLQMKTNYAFDSEMDLLASGPVIHSWEGIVNATPRDIRFNRETGAFYFTGVWSNSYEAEQYLSYNEYSQEPVCWSLMGYASGWCTAFFDQPLIAIEPVCAGKGDDHCEWLIQPVQAWGKEAEPYIDALKTFWR